MNATQERLAPPLGAEQPPGFTPVPGGLLYLERTMPYKDLEKQRQSQNSWMWRRRQMWIAENGPCNWCGSTHDLLVAFKNPATKQMKVASIWGRKQESRDKILAECEVTCRKCHDIKIRIWRAVKSALS